MSSDDRASAEAAAAEMLVAAADSLFMEWFRILKEEASPLLSAVVEKMIKPEDLQHVLNMYFAGMWKVDIDEGAGTIKVDIHPDWVRRVGLKEAVRRWSTLRSTDPSGSA